MEQVVYFSLNKKNREKFHENVNKLCYTPKYSFVIVDAKRFKNLRDLIPLIDKCENRNSLHLIIDYKSLGVIDTNECAKVMRHIIMAYPEVQFLFDETECQGKGFLTEFLFVDIIDKTDEDESFTVRVASTEAGDQAEIKTKAYYNESHSEVLTIQVQSAIHTFRFKEDKECALFLVKGRNNLYDASNLRSALKAVKRCELKVRDNYQKQTDSRRNNAAIVVEEESHQNMFNSYCLYANGFRVFPVITATELLEINKKSNESFIVVRDYDLQFIDEDLANITKKEIDGQKWCKTDFIRGAKKKEDGKFIILKDKDDLCWTSFNKENVFFVSKGGDGLKIRLKWNRYFQKKQKHMKSKGKKLILRGKDKPMEGIYKSFQCVRVIEKRYKATRYRPGEDSYKIVVKRQGEDGHSCPLDIYGIVYAMVKRAEKYYNDKKYRLAALVASESMEILNGFHPSLMKRAYYVQAISENAMSMSLLGGEESKLVDDINFRCRKIKEDIKRMVPNRKDRTNVLNGIYNDCRLFCQQVEYHDAADEVLSFFVHENEGFRVVDNLIGGVAYLWVKMKYFIRNKVKWKSRTETE